MLRRPKRLLVGRPLRGERLRETLPPKRSGTARLRRDRPRDVVVIYIPEYVVGHWWEQLLHNQSALRLKARLLCQRGLMVVSVPWQLESSHADDKQTPIRKPRSGYLSVRTGCNPAARSIDTMAPRR